MIRIFINNNELHLNPDTSIRFDLIHPAFESEFLYASMVYPFDIPSQNNEYIFMNSNHIVVNEKYRIYECRFSFADSINFSGKLVLSKLTRTAFRGSIIFNGFSIDSKDISLKDFNYDKDVLLGGSMAAVISYIESTVVDSYPDTNFNFPLINAPEWYGGEENEANPDFAGFLNSWIKASHTVLANTLNQNPTPSNVNSILPCLYLFYIIKSCFKELNFKTIGDFINHAELSQLMVFNNTPLDSSANTFSVKASNSVDQTGGALDFVLFHFDDDSTLPNVDPDGCWNTTTMEYEIKSQGYHEFLITGSLYIVPHNINPMHRFNIRIYDSTINGLIYYGDYGLYDGDTIDFQAYKPGHWFSASDIGNKIIVQYECYWIPQDEIPEESDAKFSNMELNVKNVSSSTFNSFSNSLHYSDHVPDISFGDLISSISKAFGLVYFFDHEKGIVEIEFLKSLIASAARLDLSSNVIEDSYEIQLKESKGADLHFKWDSSDLDEQQYYKAFNSKDFVGSYPSVDMLPVPSFVNVFALVQNMNAIYLYHKNPDTGSLQWDLHSYNFPHYLIPPSKQEYRIGFSPLMLAIDQNDSSVYPYTLINCSSPLFATGDKDCGLHLLFYRGMGSESDKYPFASGLAYDRFGDKNWSHELRFDGDNGLIKNFLTDWLEFIDNSQTVKMDFDLSIIDFQNIMNLFLPQTGGTKYRKVFINNVNYLPKKFSIMLTMNGIRSCQGELVKEGMIKI